ncbi:MAG: type I restriction enzyme HsdR N-terminal domain-containing protein, partial [Candidatus Cryptobacteroides sp.]
MMMSEVQIKLGQKAFRADILVYRRGGAPLMMVECKNENVSLDAAVLEQALRYNMVLDVPYIVVTNGRCTFGFERTGTGEDVPFRQLKSFPDWVAMQENLVNRDAQEDRQ